MAKIRGATVIAGGTGPVEFVLTKSTKSAYDSASITSPNFNDTTLTVPGAKLGDGVIVAPATSVPTSAGVTAGMVWGFVSAADTVTIRCVGIVGTVDFTSQDYNVYLIRAKDI